MANAQLVPDYAAPDSIVEKPGQFYGAYSGPRPSGWGGFLINGTPFVFDPLPVLGSSYRAVGPDQPSIISDLDLRSIRHPQRYTGITFLADMDIQLGVTHDWSEALIHATIPSMDWAVYLDHEDRAAMQAELAELVRSAVITGNWQPYQDALYAWHSTADILSNPELVASLNAPTNLAEEVQLKRP